jgi:hypothetical protein
MRTKIPTPLTRTYMCVLYNHVTLSPIHTNTLIYIDKTGDKLGDIGVTLWNGGDVLSPHGGA